MTDQPRCPQSAFTLIELLVVISIIAILAAMLVPAISLVRTAAQGSRCLSSQKQVALGCLGYANDNDGLLPALYLTTTPASTFWTNLILVDYLEAGKTDANHTNLDRTVMQGCSEWNRATSASANRAWQGAYGMNAYPLCENDVINLATSDFVNGGANARAIPLNQVTKQTTRLMLADALNTNGTSTYRINAVAGTVTETSNASNSTSTLLKSWHSPGKIVTITMFDGHGEKKSLTVAAAAITNPQ
jgi:prepilin-type N-terminal cleavage/methylation domain-containing protein